MSYYDDPLTVLHANLASQKSILVDYKYNYRKVVTNIINTSPEDLSEDLINQQISLIQSIRQQKELINVLESNIQTVVESINPPQPIVDISSNIVDLSGGTTNNETTSNEESSTNNETSTNEESSTNNETTSNEESSTTENNTNESNTNESNTNESNTNESNTNESSTTENNTNESNTNESNTNESNTNESNTNESSTNETTNI